MALADDNVGQKEFFIALNLNISLIPSLWQMAFNVLAVYDGFLFVMRKLRSSFSQTKNCGGTKTHKGRSPTVFLCSPSRRQAAKHIQTC